MLTICRANSVNVMILIPSPFAVKKSCLVCFINPFF